MIRKTPMLAIVCILTISAGLAQASPADSATTAWNALSNPVMDPAKSAHMENVTIVRDRVRITLTDGTIQFTQPANGVVFGAVFHGKGRVQIDPPNPIEAQQLRLFTKQDKVDMAFTDATFSFTDGLLEEVGKQVKWQASGPAPDDTYAKRQKEREDLGESILPRLLQAVSSTDRARAAYFMADLKTSEKGWIEVFDDAMDLEEMGVARWADATSGKRHDPWMSFPAGGQSSASAWKDPQAKQDFSIRSYKIDASVTTGAELQATTMMELAPRFSGQNVLVFGLDSNLRVESVKDTSGNSLTFFQAREDKDRPQSYGDYIIVVLPSPLAAGVAQSLEFRYGGKRAIRKVGNGYYYCESSLWFPEIPDSFATRADFDFTFHSPKSLTLVATADKLSEIVEGNTKLSKWKSSIPLAVAGFAYGDYKVYEDKADQVAVEVYGNREPDDIMTQVQRYSSIGLLSPSIMAKSVGIEVTNMIKLFDSYFGPYPYKQLAVTTLPINASYGQGWPGLLYLWSASFLDSTQRNAIGIKDQTWVTDYFRAHETSHQWWGHRVGWKSYHDQWLSEGFADFSGILYVQFRQNMKASLERWRREKELLENKDTHGHTIESLGPIWMGRRISSSETDGSSYQNLVYSKGAYVLYMLRMQISDPSNPDTDHLFKAMMQDYCKTFENKAASTEDFKAIVEKHMIPNMDLDRNHKMDWFFNQYVYGTGIPQYSFHAPLTPTPDGKTSVTGVLIRTGVPEPWKDVVPIYAHTGDKSMRIGTLAVTHATEKFSFVLPGKVDRLSINDNEDLLADVKQ
jgi:hypothetical protein